MIATLKHKIESVPFDFHTTIKSIAAYAWLTAGVLFAAYLYFIGAITFSVIKEQALRQEMKTLVSTMSLEEVAYLNTQKDLNERSLITAGLVAAPTVAYATVKRALAWNVAR